MRARPDITILESHAAAVLTASLAAASASCSVLLNRDGQCTKDEDCRSFSPSAVCSSGACVENAAGAGAAGPPGCFAGTPASDLEFYNRCTTASYSKFDNCDRLALCDGSYDPEALIDPPPSGPGSPPSTDVTLPVAGCYDAARRPNVILMQGSTNFTPFIQAMAPIVLQRGYTVVWQPTSSCAGAESGGFASTPDKRLMRNPNYTSQSFASFYDAQGRATPCALGNSPRSPEPGVAELTDIGQSDVFAASCGNAAWLPGSGQFSNVGHYLGPIQAMAFVTPPTSSQRVISAEAAHMVFGMGGNGGRAAPLDRSQIYVDAKRDHRDQQHSVSRHRRAAREVVGRGQEDGARHARRDPHGSSQRRKRRSERYRSTTPVGRKIASTSCTSKPAAS